MEHADEFANALKDGAAALGFSITADQRTQFTSLYEHLQRWNRKTNLTAIREPVEIAIKHFIDSLAVSNVLPRKGRIALLDVGTGAGFPGIPLKIFRPEIELTLLEPTQKKVAFLRHVTGTLGLTTTNVHASTVQDFARQSAVRFTHEVTRALRTDDLYQSLAMLLDDDGELLLCQTQPLATNAVPQQFRIATHFSYELPRGYGNRCVTALKLSSSHKTTSATNDVPRGTSFKTGQA